VTGPVLARKRGVEHVEAMLANEPLQGEEHLPAVVGVAEDLIAGQPPSIGAASVADLDTMDRHRPQPRGLRVLVQEPGLVAADEVHDVDLETAFTQAAGDPLRRDTDSAVLGRVGVRHQACLDAAIHQRSAAR
jgi:hypothetical protein